MICWIFVKIKYLEYIEYLPTKTNIFRKKMSSTLYT